MDAANQDEAARWNGPTGQAWVEEQNLLDSLFKPLEVSLAEAVAAEGARSVLDVGCGTGSTTLAAARRLGATGRCTGIDISGPMIARARERAEREVLPANFELADAQIHPFEAASFDMIISRFGVMFFADSVRAFANLRRAAMAGAELRFATWRSAADNPFMTAAERAAAPLLPNLPARRPGGPGQFAFADPHFVSSVLAGSGWGDIDIRPVDVACAMPSAELTRYLMRLGPVGLSLQQADDATRTRVLEAIRPAFDPYVHGTEVCFTAACWMASARSPGR